MATIVQYVDPVNGIDGTGTPGVDWVGNFGLSEKRPRKTIDFAAGFLVGAKVLLKRGTVYDITKPYQRINGTVVQVPVSNYGAFTENGTSSALRKDRIYFGAYGRGPRPVLDGMGVAPNGLYLVGGITVEDIEIRNCVGNLVAVATGAQNVVIRRCLLRKALGNNNNSIGVYVRGINTLIESCTFDQLGADAVLTDINTATGLKVRNCFMLGVGGYSMDGADGVVVAALGDGFEMSGCLVDKVSRQKQGMFAQKLDADANPTVAPLIENNAFLDPCEGAGMLSLISVPASVVRRNFICGPRGIGADRLTGSSRYSEGIDAYANIIVGTAHILKPDGTGAAQIDAAGYPDASCLGGSTNASAHVVNKWRHNLIYNWPSVIAANLDTGKNEAHNNIIVRTKGQALNSATNACANGNLMYDEGSSADGFAGTPAPQVWHDSGRPSGPTRIPGCFPSLTPDFGLSVQAMGYWCGDGTQVPAMDFLGVAFATDNGGAGCAIGPTQVISA